MVKIVEMDENVTLKAQLEEDVGSVILLNKFTVKPEDVDQFLKVFAITTEMFKQQPGFISAQLHRGIGGSSTFFNYVVWESAEHFKQALTNSDVLPNTVMSPHLFKKVGVPGICVDWFQELQIYFSRSSKCALLESELAMHTFCNA
jgi:quinol monooxygenase YgiN